MSARFRFVTACDGLTRLSPGTNYHGRESPYCARELFVLSGIGRTGLGRFPLRIATRSRN